MCDGHNHAAQVSSEYYNGFEDCLSVVENQGTTAAEDALDNMEVTDDVVPDVFVIFTVVLFF